ncbi:hypothetical protein [Tenacibaculum larymnensis]|uniref:THAP4-like heme-binding beta-barrel domain-containing protein n=1 Tax=Tenacibaculum larymnensis TaxID=2878201 RepID=A0A9X4ETI8_9FLAO|nr:hypothetical protein [Tenacibaculum larymnensis]MDE1206146.1 hypothetical protein [Tenacibaculum larymnensis]
MSKKILLILGLILTFGTSFAQTNPFEKIDFIIGDWTGTGTGFGNDKSKIESSFHLVMNGNYIEVINESNFEPTEKKPKGEHHLDKGFISYDKSRKTIVFRQFNNEGYYNQYFLNNDDSDENTLVFETEHIENFVPNGKAKWTVKKISENEIETVFDVSFGKDYKCFGINKLKRKQ